MHCKHQSAANAANAANCYAGDDAAETANADDDAAEAGNAAAKHLVNVEPNAV